MPDVDGKKLPYTPMGMIKAKMAMNRKMLKKAGNRDAVTKSSPAKKY